MSDVAYFDLTESRSLRWQGPSGKVYHFYAGQPMRSPVGDPRDILTLRNMGGVEEVKPVVSVPPKAPPRAAKKAPAKKAAKRSAKKKKAR